MKLITIALVLVFLAVISTSSAYHHNIRRNSRKSRQNSRSAQKIKHQHPQHMHMQTNNKSKSKSQIAWFDGLEILYDSYTPQDFLNDENLLRQYSDKAFDAFEYYGELHTWELYDAIIYNHGWAGLTPPNRDITNQELDVWLEGGYSFNKSTYAEAFKKFCERVVNSGGEQFYDGNTVVDLQQNQDQLDVYAEKVFDAFKDSQTGVITYWYIYEVNLYNAGWAQVPAMNSDECFNALDSFDMEDFNKLDLEEFTEYFRYFVSSSTFGYYV